MWDLDHKFGWMPKNWCFWFVMLVKTFESPFDSKAIKTVHPKWNQSWIFIWRTDAEAETSNTWPPDLNHWHIWKDPDSGKDLKMGGEGDDRGWDSWMSSPTQWTWVWANSGDSGGQGSLACCSLWGHRVGHDLATEQQQKATQIGNSVCSSTCLSIHTSLYTSTYPPVHPATHPSTPPPLHPPFNKFYSWLCSRYCFNLPDVSCSHGTHIL